MITNPTRMPLVICYLATCQHIQLLVHLLHGARVLHVGRLELHKPIIKMINNMFFKKMNNFLSKKTKQKSNLHEPISQLRLHGSN